MALIRGDPTARRWLLMPLPSSQSAPCAGSASMHADSNAAATTNMALRLRAARVACLRMRSGAGGLCCDGHKTAASLTAEPLTAPALAHLIPQRCVALLLLVGVDRLRAAQQTTLEWNG